MPICGPTSCDLTWLTDLSPTPSKGKLRGVGNETPTPVSYHLRHMLSDHFREVFHQGMHHLGMLQRLVGCVAGSKKTQKREKWMTLPCLAGAVRQQLILRNLAILFTFFHHKQVLGSPGWEGHVDKKRKRNHFFFFLMCVIYSDESFLPTGSFPGISANTQTSFPGPPINSESISNSKVMLPVCGGKWDGFDMSFGGKK